MGAKIFSRMYIYSHLSPRFSTFSTLIIFGIFIIFSTLIAMFIGGIQSAHESVFFILTFVSDLDFLARNS